MSVAATSPEAPRPRVVDVETRIAEGEAQLVALSRPRLEAALVPVDRITPAADNHRRSVGDVADLAESIRHLGVLQPVLLRRLEDDRYEVVCGARRLAASKQAGLESVPAVVGDFPDAQRAEAMLVENLQRVDLTPIEEAHAYQQLLGLGVDEAALAQRVGRRRDHVVSRVALLQLPRSVQRKLTAGALTLGEAQALTQLADAPEYLSRALERHAKHGWAVVHAVDEQVRCKQVEEAAAASRAALEEKGVRIIDAPQYDMFDGRAKERALGTGWDQVHLTPAKHAKEPCHAAFISSRTGEAVYVCTEPSRHAADPTAGPAAEDRRAKTAAKRAATKARKDALIARHGVLRGLLADGVAADAAVAHVLQMALDSATDDAARVACELLALSIDERGFTDRFVTALRAYAAQGPEQLLRASLALAFGVAEAALARDHMVYGARHHVGHHFAFLATLGYTLTQGDRVALAEYRPGWSPDSDGADRPNEPAEG